MAGPLVDRQGRKDTDFSAPASRVTTVTTRLDGPPPTLVELLVNIINETAILPVTELVVPVDPEQNSGHLSATWTTNLDLTGHPELAATTSFISSTTTTDATPSPATASSSTSEISSTVVVVTTTTKAEPSSSSSESSSIDQKSSATQDGAVPLTTNMATVSTSSGVSTGALAGAAVACFVAGLVTAALVLWAIGSRRRRSRPDGFSSSATMPIITGSSDESSHKDHKYVPMVPIAAKTADKALPAVADNRNSNQESEPNPLVSLIAPSQAAATAYPPSSFTIKRKRLSSASGLAGASIDTSDRSFSELRTQVKAIFEHLEMHVDNFYSSEASVMQLTEDQQHNLLQIDSPYLSDSIIGLLPEAKGDAVKSLIKHSLAYTIFSRTGGSSIHLDADNILLPDGLPILMATIQPASIKQPHNREGYQQEMDRLLWWRHETVAMMDVQGVVKSSDIQQKINKLAWVCWKGLEPWAVPRYGTEARKSHLMRAMDEAVEVGLRVFGERKGWLVWQWEPNPIDNRGGGSEGNFVMFPGLDLRKDHGNGRGASRADAESERSVGGNGVSRAEAVLAPTMASLAS